MPPFITPPPLMTKILNLQRLAPELAADGVSTVSNECNNYSETSDCCTGGCTAPIEPAEEQL